MRERVRIRSGILKQLRDMSGQSAADQADLIGVNITTLRRVDKGKTPSGSFMGSICGVYQLHLSEIFETVPTTVESEDLR